MQTHKVSIKRIMSYVVHTVSFKKHNSFHNSGISKHSTVLNLPQDVHEALD